MTGQIVQINISRGGIPKLPVAEAIVTPEGILGDSWAHPQYHGGPDQALLLICAEAIEELVAKGYPLYPGALGENLTTSGLDRRQLRAGQRYRIGDVLIELTKIRVPCSTIEVYGPAIKADLYDSQVKAGDASSPRWALGGFYAAVRRTGVIRQQDIITLVDQVV
jgi:MOSC domain-containing protein YiiM